jgi:voltage-gated potassium channel
MARAAVLALRADIDRLAATAPPDGLAPAAIAERLSVSPRAMTFRRALWSAVMVAGSRRALRRRGATGPRPRLWLARTRCPRRAAPVATRWWTARARACGAGATPRPDRRKRTLGGERPDVTATATARPWMGDRAERLERRLELPMLVVAALVIPTLILEEASVGQAWKTAASVLNWVIWLAFLGELVAMLAVVRSRRGYLLHNPVNVAIVVLTAPFLPAVFQSLRVLRLLRVARLLRLAPLFRLAFTLRGLRYASVFTLLVVLVGAEAYESAEPGKDYFDGIYWAVSTMTTVGYGDELPTTTEAKVVAMVLVFVGIGYAAVVTGAIAERFIERGREEEAEALGPVSPGDLAAHVDRLTVAAHELTAELDALRTMVAVRASGDEQGP